MTRSASQAGSFSSGHTEPGTAHLLEEGLERVVTRLLHLAVDVSTETGHDLEQSSVVVHEAAAELGRVFGEQSEPGCSRGRVKDQCELFGELRLHVAMEMAGLTEYDGVASH